MIISVDKPDLTVDGIIKISIDREGQKMVVTYADLQIGDSYYHHDEDGIVKHYRVINIGGTAEGDAEVNTSIINLTHC